MTATHEDVVICTMGHMSGHDVFATGQLVRRDHPGVARNPTLFAHPETPRGEWPSIVEGAIRAKQEQADEARAEREARFLEAAKANPRKLEAPAVVKCREAHAAHVDGRPTWIERGSTALANAPHVLDRPELWKP